MLRNWPATIMGFLFCLFFLTAAAEADMLKIPFNKNTLIHLDRDAASVLVNNPDRISVLLDNPRTLIVVPHQAGASSFIALDGRGQTILQKEIIVSNVREKYVRIRRACTGNDATCSASTYSYCPNGCYDVTAVAKGSGGGGAAPPPAKQSAAEAPPPTIDGEPIDTMIGPDDSCPAGYNSTPVPEDPTGQGRKCVQK